MHGTCHKSASAEPLMTIRELHKLRNELDLLIHERREEIRQQIEHARQFGDLSENQEYTDAREMQIRNEMEIQQLENRISGTRLILPGMQITADERRQLQEQLDARQAHCDMLLRELRNVYRRQPSPRKTLYQDLLRGAMRDDRAEISSLRVILDTATVVDDERL